MTLGRFLQNIFNALVILSNALISIIINQNRILTQLKMYNEYADNVRTEQSLQELITLCKLNKEVVERTIL